MKKIPKLLVFVSVLLLIGGLAYQLPMVRSRVDWRIDIARTFIRAALRPVGRVPTAVPAPVKNPIVTGIPLPTPIATPEMLALVIEPSPTPLPTVAAILTPTAHPLPAALNLPAPAWEKQGWNNCGPATLALALRFYGWEGNQYDISAQIKPQPSDRNVNVEELISYLWNNETWLQAEFRVGGNHQLLKEFLAAGMPVIIEEGMELDQAYWPNDDLWAGHYLLLTGYDDTAEEYITQDSFYGADQRVGYDKLDLHWKAFNRVYILLFPPDMEARVNEILGPHADFVENRRLALEIARSEIAIDPEDSFAWFNLGSNLVYFERYVEAADAFDEVRQLGVPQRMWRYQFSPFMAYFHTNRIDDLLVLTEYALQITELSEEALLWRGWAFYRMGKIDQAIESFRLALGVNPYYQDAIYALNFMGVTP